MASSWMKAESRAPRRARFGEVAGLQCDHNFLLAKLFLQVLRNRNANVIGLAAAALATTAFGIGVIGQGGGT